MIFPANIFKFFGFPKEYSKYIEHLNPDEEIKKNRIYFNKLKEIKPKKPRIYQLKLGDDNFYYILNGFYSNLRLGGFKPLLSATDLETNQTIPLVDINKEKNSIIFNFDIDKAISFVLQEEYVAKKRPLYSYLPFNIDIIPSPIRKFSLVSLKRIMKKKPFPLWPLDYSTDKLRFFFKDCLEKVIGGNLKYAAFWPKGKKYAVILTHDVDCRWIYNNNNLDLFAKSEKENKSAWYFIVKFKNDLRILDRLFNERNEIGLHCYNHDHKLPFLKITKIKRRLDKCIEFIKRYNVKGFRSAHFLRTKRLFNQLANYVEYECSIHSSYKNPSSSNEGCCSVFPFFIKNTDLLEIPTTIAEDYEFEFLGLDKEKILEKQINIVNNVKKIGGVVNILTHPDPKFSAKDEMIYVYARLLEKIRKDKSAWIILPKELNKWWRKRNKNTEEKLK